MRMARSESLSVLAGKHESSLLHVGYHHYAIGFLEEILGMALSLAAIISLRTWAEAFSRCVSVSAAIRGSERASNGPISF